MKELLVQIDHEKKLVKNFSEFASDLREYYRIRLTYTSNALEGNTLTEIETKVILEDGLTVSENGIHSGNQES